MKSSGQAFIFALTLAVPFAAHAAAPDEASGASAGGSASAQSAGPSGGAAQAPNGHNQNSPDILDMKAGEITGRQLYNAEGKELGKVDMVGRDRDTGALDAIVSVGGFLGLGGSKVAIPIEQLSFRDNKLTASTTLSRDELRKGASAYKAKKYERIAQDTTLSQVAPAQGSTATAPEAGQPQAGVTFQSLDRNRDGFISQDEARSDPTLESHWSVADTNRDGKIDRSEFSAFEEQQIQPGTGGQMQPGTGGQMQPGTGSQAQPGTGSQMEPGTGGQMQPGTGGPMREQMRDQMRDRNSYRNGNVEPSSGL